MRSLSFCFLAAAFLPLVLSGYGTEVAWSVLFYMLLALGCNVSVGYAGLWDMGYAAKYAVGAYVSGILMLHGVSFWLTLPVSMVVGCLLAVMTGYPVLKLRGDYLAIVTLGLGEVIRITARNLPVTGGAQGLNGLPRPSFFGIPLTDSISWYYVFLLLVFLFTLFSHQLEGSRLGREFRCIREDEDAAAAQGIHVQQRKLLAYTVSSVMGAVTGSFYAAKMTAVAPGSFTFLQSANILLAVVLGGAGKKEGALLGAAFFVLLPELFRFMGESRMLIFGLLLVLVMIFCPEGIWGFLRSFQLKK